MLVSFWLLHLSALCSEGWDAHHIQEATNMIYLWCCQCMMHIATMAIAVALATKVELLS